MTCIHGLDEINCPTCRIINSTLPMKRIKLKETNFLKATDLVHRKNLDLENNLINELGLKKINPNPPNLIRKPLSINEIPNFQNELFLKKSRDLDLVKKDNQGISKKITLESPEWNFEDEE
ncbi:MAG: hypothetical protein JSV62_10875 [Promethearchaeota archaeon]|nr:MAG: hypothetical protein JSV62_10875 [Candidatus Lokiarchaeota archaeon]